MGSHSGTWKRAGVEKSNGNIYSSPVCENSNSAVYCLTVQENHGKIFLNGRRIGELLEVMSSFEDRGRPLPKFGEWDVNNPASAEGFTVIFNKARDEKKTTGTAASTVSPQRNESIYNNETFPQYHPPKKRWFCCG
ncbi:uncharacterized protein LOC111008714 isoform X2 [Momordica charantia]|uniref:Uncharacterized protein LOC111008714 isoform X2 n=1 Tax=Momordica charantia TaxID=3673 RepID=A0A6J1C5Z3_MOMCH|nr:uncharacterized protein LOC111008714 isoform X2 [Momordica charantia]